MIGVYAVLVSRRKEEKDGNQTVGFAGYWLVGMCMVLALSTSLVLAEGGIVEGSMTSTAYGTFNGVPFIKYTGRFVGTTAGDYSVGFEIVAPKDPSQGNGILVMEAEHVMGGTAARDAYFTPAFLFGRGFSYAGIWWHPDDVDPFAGYSAEEANEILHNFALALRQDAAMQKMIGPLQKLYGVGLSKTTEPMLTFIASPAQSLLDFTFLIVPSWPGTDFKPPAGANRIMVFNVEADRIMSTLTGKHTEMLRETASNYRSYEVAGAPHVPDVPRMRELGPMYGVTSEGTTPLDWTPVMRALFIDGHLWTTAGVEPPPSTHLWDAPFGQIDAVYQSVYGLALETGINRDEIGNAQGGIRLPDVELGRGVYIAADPGSFYGMALFGSFQDLQCVSLADGSPRFADHATYVSLYTAQVENLVDQRFLLPEDAANLISQAAMSNVGDPAACAALPISAPILLPSTGPAADQGISILSVAFLGLIMLGAGFVACRLRKASR